MIFEKLNPVKNYKDLLENLEELSNYRKYKKIIFELEKEEKLQRIGFAMDGDANLYLGIDLNPELLMYSETSQESVELKLVSEKMTKYTDFLTKEGILDAVKVDYDRVHNEEYYGYILKISYAFKKYKKSDFRFQLIYFSTLLLGAVALSFLLV
jgi:hypothetical protein